MNKLFLQFIPVVMAVFIACGGINASAGDQTASPNLLAAAKSLHTATHADDPMPDLQEALTYLNKATNNAGGYKDKAIVLVNAAIDLAKNGNKTEMIPKIEHAIALLDEGMSRGGRRHN